MRNGILPIRREAELLPEHVSARVIAVDDDGASTTLEEQVFLSRAVAYWQPRRIFEIGTHRGRSTLNMAANAPDGCEIFTLDLPPSGGCTTLFPLMPEEEALSRWDKSRLLSDGTAYEKSITRLTGDSAVIDLSPWHDTIDMVYVDGAHSADYVLNDSTVAWRLVGKQAGRIIWHDYSSLEQVDRVLSYLYQRDPRFGGLCHVAGTRFALLDVRHGVRAPNGVEQSGSSAGA